MTDAEFIEIMNCNDPVELRKKQTASQYLQAVYVRRRKNLRLLYKEHCYRSEAVMARQIATSTATLNDYLAGRSDICEKRARMIEGAMRLPFGTLDKEVP